MSTYTFVNDGRILRVTMEGSVDLSISPSLKTDVEQLISSDTLAVHLLASDVTYIDSSGVASLLFIKKLCQRFGCKFVFESISTQVIRVIELANLGIVLGLSSGPSYKVQATNIDKPTNQVVVEPKFSDSEALAIFQNDLDSERIISEKSNTFQIKPGSFS